MVLKIWALNMVLHMRLNRYYLGAQYIDTMPVFGLPQNMVLKMVPSEIAKSQSGQTRFHYFHDSLVTSMLLCLNCCVW